MPKPVLIGVPYDAESSFRRGAAGAPRRVRAALRSPAGNPWSERLVEAATDEALEDRGDLRLSPAGGREAIERATHELARDGRRIISIGGDHSITVPILRGLREAYPSLTVVQVDAHPDLYDEFDGDRHSHACPFARVMEERLATRLVQIGIRASTGHQDEQARRFGVEQIDMRAWTAGRRPAVEGDWYLSIDLDGIDPAFAPGVAHREPGGLSVRDVLGLIDGTGGHLVGADVVELNPGLDVSDLTAGVAAKLVTELAGRMIADGGRA